jgi:uncharacterized protein with HEPN domain
MRAALADIRSLKGAGKDAFRADRTVQQAVALNLAVLGEAARALSEQFRQRHPDVPWRDLIAQRNVVIHTPLRGALPLPGKGAVRRDRCWSSV